MVKILGAAKIVFLSFELTLFFAYSKVLTKRLITFLKSFGILHKKETVRWVNCLFKWRAILGSITSNRGLSFLELMLIVAY